MRIAEAGAESTTAMVFEAPARASTRRVEGW